jgi:hypothetical protein
MIFFPMISRQFSVHKNLVPEGITMVRAQQSDESSPSYDSMSDEELISCCLDKHREAWNEFLHRFIPLIKNAIKKRLIESGQSHLYQDKDVIWDIWEKIVKNYFDKVNSEIVLTSRALSHG